MCPPDHYGVEYEINPWMDRARRPEQNCAGEQWRGLRDLLSAAGAEIELIEPAPGLPDMVFTANAGLIDGQRVVLSNFRHPQRQPEAARFAAWFAAHGYEIIRMPDDHCFEGAGDALACGDELFAGYRFRSDVYSHQLVSEVVGMRVRSLELVDPRFYHLDTCFCPLGPESALYYPPAFDKYGRSVIEATIPDAIALCDGDAERFGANAVVLDGQVVLNSGCDSLVSALRDRGWNVRETPLSEYIKAGGAARCLTLQL